MPLTTLTRLKDELVSLYGEDRISVFVTMTARKQVDDWLKGGTTKINNKLSFGQDDPIEPTANRLREVFKQLVVGLNDEEYATTEKILDKIIC
ncbi:MAG: hypothetical protein OXF47_10515 [Nitrospira sp.]|nr:hypothetical protein [Nitrospira sp.]